MNPFRALRRLFINSSRSVQVLGEIREGIANLTDVLNRRLHETDSSSNTARSVHLLEEIREGIANLTDVADRTRAEGEAVRLAIAHLSEALNQRSNEMGVDTQPEHDMQPQPEVGDELSGVGSSDLSREGRSVEKDLPVTDVGGLRFEKRVV